MKRLLIAMSLITGTANAQMEKINLPPTIKVGEVKSLATFIADLGYYIEGTDTTYMLSFNNLKYQTLKDTKFIYFKSTGGTFNSLYQAMLETLDQDKGTDNIFKLGKDEVMIKSERMMGAKYIKFFILENGAYFQLTKKQIDKLFGK